MIDKDKKYTIDEVFPLLQGYMECKRKPRALSSGSSPHWKMFVEQILKQVEHPEFLT